MKRDLPFEVTESDIDGDVWYLADCPKGLWSVWTQNRDAVEREAWHYYRQYEADGEYSEQAIDNAMKGADV